jgi:hypothetical protein
MTTIPHTATGVAAVPRVSAAPRAKAIFYVRSVVAIAMIATWAVSAVSGIALWLAADGRGAFELPAALGLTKHTWDDIHVVASFLAIGLTLVHVTVMRRGVLSYARLVLTGQRSTSTRAARRPKAVVYVRAVAVVVMVALVPLAVVSGIVPWLAPEVRRAGQQILLLMLTKRDWVDVHTAITMGAILVAMTHVVVVRAGLVADVRLLVTGQRSAPRTVRR